MVRFRLKVLGTPSITDEDGTTPPSLGWGKPLALLCLLSVRGEVRREEVVDLLWRDVEESKARNAFRQALHRLRTALGDDLLPQDRERIRLVRSAALVVDLDEFEKAVTAGRLEDALRSYAGDFLENSELGEPAFDQWCEHERTRLQARFRQALQDAIAQSATEGKWTESIARARRLQALAPFDAGAAQLAATTMVSAGRRVEALELLRQFAARLQADLGLPLPAELQALATRLERQPFATTPARPGTPASPADFELRFAGREPELSRLLSLWRSTADDSGSLALIEGAGGIGKSRLVRELASHAKSLGRVTVLLGRERATGVPLPFGVLAEALRPLVRAAGVAGASRHLLAEAARLLPELRDNFDLPPVSDVADEASRVRFFEGVAALIDAAAYEQPVLLVLEDLHAVTPSSLDLITYLCARLAGSAVMFVLSVRDADAPPAVLARLRQLAELSDGAAPPHGGRALRIALGSIPAADAAQVTSEAGRAIGLADGVVSRITLRAERNPGRLVALLRLAAGGDELNAAPVSMRDLISGRLQQLSSAQRRFFVAVALIGRPVSAQLAADAGHVSLTAARETAIALEHDGLVDRISDDLFAAGELAAQIAMDAAGAASRSFLAGWIVDALSRDPRASAAELARFYAMAGQTAPAFEYARRAAYSAIGMGAVAEAVQSLTSARTFASTPQQQEQIESLLGALGSGRRRIGAPGIATQPSEVPRADAPRVTAREHGEAGAAAVARSWERLFPNWRILFGAAVASLVISAAVLASRSDSAGLRAQFLDTLVLSDGQSGVRYVTGDPVAGLNLTSRLDAPRSEPPWLDSLTRPWSDAVASPNGRSVAAARVTAEGSDVYVLSGSRSDTLPVVVGLGDSRPLGWSPDGRWLLARSVRRAGGAFDADLRAYRVDGIDAATRVVDTIAGHATAEAAWSPDGSRIAWVARVGAERQLEVFVSLADGSEPRNVSRHPADDSHIAWSSDGELLAFTSTRDGNAELYAMGVRENRLWRLTRDPAQDDRGSFSRNGRFIAFESTRGGSAGVYVMPGLGGVAQQVAGGPTLGVVGWRAGRARYVDRVRVEPAAVVQPGETTSVRLLAADQFDEAMPGRDVVWTVLDSNLASVIQVPDSAPDMRLLLTRRAGLARVVGTAAHWRSDTAFVRIGTQAITLIEPTLPVSRAWNALGSPAPRVSAAGSVVLGADRQWDSGILSRTTLPLLTGLTVSLSLHAPLATATDMATAVTVALVAPENVADIQQDAPQFLKYASVSWSADAKRIVYAVGQEAFSEPVAPDAPGAVALRLVVEPDSTISFSVDGRQRWRSSLRVISPRNEPRAQLWIGGRATGDLVRVSEISAALRP